MIFIYSNYHIRIKTEKSDTLKNSESNFILILHLIITVLMFLVVIINIYIYIYIYINY